MMDEDYYILSLAAIGRERNTRHLSSARVHLSVGLPLTWVSEQKDEFLAYLLFFAFNTFITGSFPRIALCWLRSVPLR